MGVNRLPKTVPRRYHSCDLNPGPSVPESNPTFSFGAHMKVTPVEFW